MSQAPNAASVALIDRNRVLLIERARAPWLGMWSLPGGRLESGEDAETCARREIMEEVGITAFALRPLTRLALAEGRFVLQVFATEGFEGEVVTNDEIGAHRWATLDEAALLPTTPHLLDVLTRAFRLFDRS